MLKYKDFSLIKPNVEQSQRISYIIENHNGSIFHEVALNKIVQKHFKTELLYLVDKVERISCFTPVHITKDKFGTKRYNCNPLGDIPYAGFAGTYDVTPSEISSGFFESIKYVGFPYPDEVERNGDNSYGETAMVDLLLNEDDIFNKMTSAKRRNIRKALKNGIEVKSFTTLEGLKIFWPILEQLHKSLGYHRFNFNYYKEFINLYGEKNKAFILIAYKNERPISGLFILGNKNYMHFYKGATLFDVKNEGQSELLHWEAIKLSKSLNVKYYDLCNLNKEELPGIYKFKTGISSFIIPYKKYTQNNIGFKILNKI